MQATLSVIQRFDPAHDATAIGGAIESVFEVNVDRDLDWIKEHADAIAQRATNGKPYHALMVRPA